MTTNLYGIAAVTKNKLNVVVTPDSSDVTNAVRVIIDDTLATSKEDVLLALEAIYQKFREGPWPLV